VIDVKSLYKLSGHNFKDKERALNCATSNSDDLQLLPFEDILYGHYRMDVYQPELIEMLLAKMTPDNMCYYVVSKEFAGRPDNQREEWYNSEYRKIKIDKVCNLNTISFLIEFFFKPIRYLNI
jgi:secreted Zn-dependent insulinase-like peptidase